eukprot:scaffold1349_cov246-Alexandrium_tamarense.AAC.2
MEKKRDPFELSTVLIGETWKLFEGQLKMRNTILHSPDSFLLASEITQLDRRFVECKRNKTQLLAYQDHYLIDIPERELVKWERDKKKKLLRLLETCKTALLESARLVLIGNRLSLRSFVGSTRPKRSTGQDLPSCAIVDLYLAIVLR